MDPDALLPGSAVTGGGLEHCPHCRGAVRPGAPWCTQCWTDLRPAPPVPAPGPAGPVAPPSPAVVPPSAVPAPRHAAPEPVLAAPGAGWPCAGCGTTNAFDLEACAACGAGFLAAVRAEQPPLLVLPGLGDVSRLGRAQRLGLAAAFALAVALLVLLVGVLG